MKRRTNSFIALWLASMIALTVCISNSSAFIITGKAVSLDSNTKKTGKYPTECDLTLLYKSEKEWNEDYAKAEKLLDKVSEFKGKLNTAQNINDYFQFTAFGEYNSLYKKMTTYEILGDALNPSDATFSELNAKLKALNAKKDQLTAFADPEIFSMSLSDRKKIFSDSVFKGREYWYRKYTDPDYKPMTEDEKRVSAAYSITDDAEKIWEVLFYSEVPAPIITMPDGTEQELTYNLYLNIIQSREYDNAFKEKAWKTTLTQYKGYINTFTALQELKCKHEFAKAQVEGFDSTMDRVFYNTDLSTDVYDRLVDAAHEGLSDYHRYVDLHKKGLGLEKQNPYNMWTTVSDFDPGKKDYDDAVGEVISALSVLGDDYIDLFTKIITSGHVDVYPSDTKISSEFMEHDYMDDLPWIFLNYNGYSINISAIAHEMGHACYGEWSSENQPAEFKEPTIFTHEITSIANELIYYHYMLKNAKDDSEKLYYLENLIELYRVNFFGQMWYAEFEDYLYKTVESGSSLDPETCCDKWAELVKNYNGDSLAFAPDGRYTWIEIPHFYKVYYVFQYAADITYANYIVEKINSGDKDAIDEYKEFLKLGSSASPSDLLKKTGIDPQSKEPYDNLLKTFGELVDEYERLVNARVG